LGLFSERYNGDEKESLQASVTAEEYTKQDELLQRLTGRHNDFKANAKEEPQRLRN